MNAHRRIDLLPLIVACCLATSANAQFYKGSGSGPYGGTSQYSGGGASSGGATISTAPQVTLGPFGPQLNYFTPLGYVMQPAIVGMPTYFGPSIGVNMNGTRFYGYGFLQGSVGALNSNRYPGSSIGTGSQGQSGTGTQRIQVNSNGPARKRFDQFLDEHFQINPEELKRKQQRELLLHSMTNPAKSDITSGAALNTILESLIEMRPQFKEAPEMPIPPQLIKDLNFTKGSGTGSFGLLRYEGKIPWPASLLSMTPKEESANLRNAIDKDFLEAYQQIAMGMGMLDTLKQIQRNTDQLSNLVSGNIRNMGINDYMEAKQFLKSVEDSVTFLKQPDAADWLPGKSKIKPKTMQELIHIMSEKAIRFAPALVGNDNAYLVMHQMLVNMHKAVAADAVRIKQ